MLYKQLFDFLVKIYKRFYGFSIHAPILILSFGLGKVNFASICFPDTFQKIQVFELEVSKNSEYSELEVSKNSEYSELGVSKNSEVVGNDYFKKSKLFRA